MTLVKRLADHEASRSLATRLRRRRFALFERLLASLPRPVEVLDVGGTQRFWEMMGFRPGPGVRVTLLNPVPQPVTLPHFRSLAGDARSMTRFADGEFDVVFSNSVIEHVGGFDDQLRMALEIRRVGKRYFVQTPNRYFPMEAHFLVPGFQFLPLSARAFLHARFHLGWPRARSYAEAMRNVARIRLLSRRELQKLFPGTALYRERLFGLTKSLIAYSGWEGAGERRPGPGPAPREIAAR